MIDIKDLKAVAQNFTLLYVEDDINIQASMSKYLQKFFKKLYTASNGKEGVALFKENSIDIVITDLSMPLMNGIEMIEQIKSINEHQAILITTAHSESEYLLGAIKSHVDGYIIKPFDFKALNFELYKISQKLQALHENEEYKRHLQDMLLQQTKEMHENYEKTLYSMVELIEQRDTYTAGHSKRVAYYCRVIAEEMGYSKEECEKLHQAAILHDIGKIETPDSVLLNPMKLNEIEYKLIQEHVSVGFKLLKKIPMFEPLAEIVYEHHERYDGSGYPKGLAAEEITPLARIMIVADAFDAMTTNRIYKGRKSVSEALLEIASLSAVQFHPEVVKSALIVLRDVKIDENINQLPQTKLEEERFAYFYNDRVTRAYNQNYLELILMRNQHEKTFHHMIIFSLSDFSSYNRVHGWSEGDKLLHEFAEILLNSLEDSLLFRVFGDDFIVLCRERYSFSDTIAKLDLLMQRHSVLYKMHEIDVAQEQLDSLRAIERKFLS